MKSTKPSQLVSPEYQELLKLHRVKNNAKWGNTGYHLAPSIKRFATHLGCKAALDYGCGYGSLKACLMSETMAVKRIKWTLDEYDPGVVGKDTCPTKQYDMVICTDVMEHVEPELVDNVLAHIRELTTGGAYLAIALFKASERLPDGRGAHITLKPADEWLRLVGKHFGEVRVVHETAKMVHLECRP